MKLKEQNFSVVLALILAVVLGVGSSCKSSIEIGKTDSAENKIATNNTSNNKTTTNTGTTNSGVNPFEKKDIAGQYSVSGANTDGQGNYTGDLVVTNRDEVYQFSWDSMGKKSDGVGVQTDNTVAVAFTDGTNGKGCGVVLYKILPDGSLDGKAGYWGVNQSESEKAVRTSGTDLQGEYEITGKNPDGKEYKGKLTVKQEGSGYQFNWTAPSAFEGFGVKQGNTVSVGLGGKQCGFVAYEVKSDGSLDGKWGGFGTKTFGTETAKKK